MEEDKAEEEEEEEEAEDKSEVEEVSGGEKEFGSGLPKAQ
jgi:hypothetical protein